MNPMWLVCSLAAMMAQTAQPTRVTDLAWIAGHWQGTKGKSQIEEHWLPPSGGAMLAVSRTLVENRMTAFEFLRIEERDDVIYYVAQPQGRPPTDFRLIRISAREAIFENAQHDFPQRIIYRLEGEDELVARIEGPRNGKTVGVDFRYRRTR